MLLSIVECSDYRKSAEWKTHRSEVTVLDELCEKIGPVRAPSAATMRNKGAQESSGRWIFFKDDDCDIDLKTIKNICLRLEETQSPIKILGGIYQPDATGMVGEIYSFIQRNWVLSGLEKTRSKQFRHGVKLLGGAFLIERKIFEDLNGFSEDVGWGAEEVELIQRARKQGVVTAISYRLRVTHRKEMNLAAFVKRAWYQNYNPGYFSFKRGASFKTGISYFSAPVKYWPSLILFFGVGTLANSFGVVARKLGFLWR